MCSGTPSMTQFAIKVASPQGLQGSQGYKFDSSVLRMNAADKAARKNLFRQEYGDNPFI